MVLHDYFIIALLSLECYKHLPKIHLVFQTFETRNNFYDFSFPFHALMSDMKMHCIRLY